MKVQLVAFSPNGKFISFLDYKSVVVWNFIERKEEFRLHGHYMVIRSFVFTADGKYLISGSDDKLIIFWNVREQKKEFKILAEDGINSMATSNNGKLISTISSGGSLSLWCAIKKQVDYVFYHTNITSVVFSPDSNHLSGSCDKNVKVWSIPKKELIFTLSTENSQINSVIFSLDQKKLFAGSSNSKIFL